MRRELILQPDLPRNFGKTMNGKSLIRMARRIWGPAWLPHMCAALNVSESTAHNWIKQNRVPRIRANQLRILSQSGPQYADAPGDYMNGDELNRAGVHLFGYPWHVREMATALAVSDARIYRWRNCGHVPQEYAEQIRELVATTPPWTRK